MLNMRIKKIAFVGIMTTLFACNQAENNNSVNEGDSIKSNKDSLSLNEVDVQKDTLLLARKIYKSIKEKNYTSIAQYIHPDAGLRFSPYCFVQSSLNFVYKKDKYLKELEQNSKLYWGEEDASGDSIVMTMKDYFANHVTGSYLDPLEPYELTAGTTMSDNTEEIFTGCSSVNFVYPGSKEHDGMDWKSLTMFFKKYENNYYLVGLVNNAWAI